MARLGERRARRATERLARARTKAQRTQLRTNLAVERRRARALQASIRRAQREARRSSGDTARSAGRSSRIGRVFGYLLPALSALVAMAYLAGVLVLGTNPPAAPIRGVSMNPLLHQGDLVLLHNVDPAQLRVGDLIGFRTTELTQMTYAVPGQIVHRIVSIATGNAGLVFTTKGDSNAEPDPFRTLNLNVIGKVETFVPYLGYPFLYADTAQAKAVGALALLLFVVWLLIGWIEARAKESATRDALLAGMMSELPVIRDQLDLLQRRLPASVAREKSPDPVAWRSGPVPSDVDPS